MIQEAAYRVRYTVDGKSNSDYHIIVTARSLMDARGAAMAELNRCYGGHTIRITGVGRA